MLPFEPHPLLHNSHAMTLAAAFWPRRFPWLSSAKERLFEVEPGCCILAHCHWQPDPPTHPTLVLVHGLEGSSASPYMLGSAEKAFATGFNVVRLNQRNCGGTEHLCSTIYNSGLSGDLLVVLLELAERDGLSRIFFAGYSMGGNLVLKMAGELGAQAPQALRGVCGVCPALDLAACADAIARPENVLYQKHFIRSLKARLRRKAQRFAEFARIDGIGRVRTLRDWDNVVTAPRSGYRDAADYYERASALRLVAHIRVPTLVIAAQNDPFVPLVSFRHPSLTRNSHIALVAPAHGGHCAFISRCGGAERYWAEARIVEFCRENSGLRTG